MSSADKRPYAALNAPFDHRNDNLVRDFETVIVLAARAVAAEPQRRNERLTRMNLLVVIVGMIYDIEFAARGPKQGMVAPCRNNRSGG